MLLEKVALLRRRQGFIVIALSVLTVILLAAVGVGVGVASASSSWRRAPRAGGIIVYSQEINPVVSIGVGTKTKIASLSLPAGTFLIESTMNLGGESVTCHLDLTVGAQTSVLDSADVPNFSPYYVPFMSVNSLSSPGTVAIDCTSVFSGGTASEVKLIATEVSKNHVQV